MGEIATWSAVKTKVGLGKTANDCPTKAELLALSPTGTGESYVGLELSNASSYKDTECVKLEDIHKVTYKYTYVSQYNGLNFAAIGGTPISENKYLNITSTKQKYWDGIAQGSAITVGQSRTSLSWVTYSSATNNEWTATENLELTARSGTITYTQAESGKTLQVTMSQAAASQSWTYGWSVTPTSMSFGATGGTKTFAVTSYKQEVRNGHNYGNQITLTYTRANSGSVSGTGTSVIMPNNTSTTAKSGTITLTQAETGKKLTISCSQSAGYLTYSEITVSGGAVTDIPASGGTRSSFTTLPTYSQTYGWNGATSGAGTVTSGASISYGTAVSANSLGTTAKARTLIGNLIGTLSLNGKTKSVSVNVYQAENKITSTTDGTPVISLSANNYTIPNTGGSVNISASVSIPTTNHWSSGSTSAGTAKSATPTVSVSGTGFSLNAAKTVLTASQNTGTSSRTGTVTATYTGATTKTITVTQSAASVTYNYMFTTSPSIPGTDSYTVPQFTNDDGSFSVEMYSYKSKYINGIHSGDTVLGFIIKTKPDWVIDVSGATVIDDTSYDVLIEVSQNTGAARSGTIVIVQDESGEEFTFNVSQAAGSVSYNYYFSVSPSSLSFGSAGATKYLTVSSYRKQVINGVEQNQILPVDFSMSGTVTGFTTTPGMGTITPGATGGYNITVTASKNSSTSSRGFTLGFTQKNSNKKVDIIVSQSGVSVTYNYYLRFVSNGTRNLEKIVVALANVTENIVAEAYTRRVVDGVEETTKNPSGLSLVSKPSWVSKVTIGLNADIDGTYNIKLTVDENTSSTAREGKVVIKPDDNDDEGWILTITVKQNAATITYEYVFEIF